MELEGTIFLLAGNRTFRFPAGKTEDSMPESGKKTGRPPGDRACCQKKPGKVKFCNDGT